MLDIVNQLTPPSADGFRNAMRQFVGQVSIITVGAGDERSGLVATSAISLSMDPPLMLVCVNRTSSSHQLFAKYGHFAVNTLSPDQQPIAERFAGKDGTKGVDRYAVGDWTSDVTGAPILRDAAIALDCELEDMIDKATHSILIGRVRAIQQRDSDSALVYWRGQYLAVGA